MELIKKYQKELYQACIQAQVEELYVFGSILTDKFHPNSDIDFIVSIAITEPLEYGEKYFNLKFDLEQIFQRKIDLLEAKAIRNDVFKNLINQKKQLIYGRKNKSLATGH
jgi:uncharacterized protein